MSEYLVIFAVAVVATFVALIMLPFASILFSILAGIFL